MGAVYLARQIRPSRPVAVKILLPNITTDSQLYREFLARFRREADVIAKLDHINIIPIYEYGEQAGLAYLVMPPLLGGSLRDLLARNGALTLQEASTFINQAAAALDYAHAQGVIHRDLKPGNFLLHNDGRLVLTDFGIARIVQDGDSTFRATLTNTGMLLGTPEYMAPEMVLGEPIDAHVDIYALGIILFQMLSGQVPFTGNTPYAVATQHLQVPPPSLHQRNPAISPAIDSVIQKALAKKREDRFPTAGALALALQQAITDPHYLSETAVRNAPTVISSHRPQVSPPTPPPPSDQSANAVIETALPTRPHNEPSSGGFSPPVAPAYPVTPYPAPTNKQQPWLIFFGVLLVLILTLGGVMVGLLLNRGTTTNPPSSTGTSTTINTSATQPSNSTPASGNQVTPTSPPTTGITPTLQPTPTQPTNSIPKGALLYSATSPGTPCDSSGGHWANYNSPMVSCQGNGTSLSNPNASSPDLVGTLLYSMPNRSFPSNYVIEVTLQPAAGNQADFGVYFRNQPGNAQGVYTFFVHSDGTWSSYVYDNTTGAPTTIKQGPFGSISGPLALDVVVIGSNFSFYSNGTLVGTASDTTYATGTVGIALDAGGSIFASNFRLYSIS